MTSAREVPVPVVTEGGKPVTVRAVGSRVVVVLDPPMTHYGDPELGIVTHDYSYKQPVDGTVVAVGPRAALGLGVGDRIHSGKYNGTRLWQFEGPNGRQVWSMDSDHSRPLPHVPDVYAGFEEP